MQKVERTAVEAARRKFSPEFMNRLDKIVVFHPLQRDQLEEVLEIELTMVQQRVLETAKGQFLFRVTESGREFLLQEGTDQRYGARHLKRAIERHVVYPMANLLATEQVHFGDMICIDRDSREDEFEFRARRRKCGDAGAPRGTFAGAKSSASTRWTSRGSTGSAVAAGTGATICAIIPN